MNTKNFILVGVGVVLVIAAAAFGGTQTTNKESIKIGVVYGLTGPAAFWTDYGIKAVKLAVSEINESGGVNGREIELIIEDSNSSPAKAVSAYQKLTDVDKVDVVIGDVWSFITNPMIPTADDKKTVLISPTVMDMAVETESQYFYTMGHTVESIRTPVQTFFETNEDIKTVSILCWNDAWGQAHTALYKEVAAEYGVEVVGEVCLNDFASDYRTEMSKSKVQDPDAIMMVVAYPDIAMRAYRAFGMDQKVLSTYITDAIELRDMPRQDAANIWFIDWMANDSFAQKFRAAYSMSPILEAQNHYDSVYAIAHALEKNPNDLAAGLASVKFDGVDGVIDFTQSDNIRVNTSKAGLYRVDPVSGYTQVK